VVSDEWASIRALEWSVAEERGKPNRGWIWYFVILGGLTSLAITVLVLYNLRQQLKPEQLEAARKLWDAKRPSDYVLTYTKTGAVTGTFIVKVRKGKVVSVDMRQEVPGEQAIKVVELERRLYRDHDMGGLFDAIERFLEMDAQKDSPRPYVRALFDPHNGQLRQYVRRVMGTRERIQIDVEPIQTPG
jgi:hypothetical protein